MNKRLILLLITLLSIVGFSQSAVWNLKTALTVSSVSGVTANTASLSKLSNLGYTREGIRVAPTITGKSWSQEFKHNSNRYINFTIVPLTGQEYTISYISFNAVAYNTTYINLAVYYSTNSGASWVKATNNINIPKGNVPQLYGMTVTGTVARGKQLLVRLYPYSTVSGSTQRYLWVNGLSISGTARLAERAPSVTVAHVQAGSVNTGVVTVTVTDRGSANISALGICFKRGSTPTIADSTIPASSVSATSYTVTLPSTWYADSTYRIVAYATNSAGTTYSSYISYRVPLHVYYNKAGQDISVLSSWGTNYNGTGTAPSSFHNASDKWYIVNSFTIGSAFWGKNLYLKRDATFTTHLPKYNIYSDTTVNLVLTGVIPDSLKIAGDNINAVISTESINGATSAVRTFYGNNLTISSVDANTLFGNVELNGDLYFYQENGAAQTISFLTSGTHRLVGLGVATDITFTGINSNGALTIDSMTTLAIDDIYIQSGSINVTNSSIISINEPTINDNCYLSIGDNTSYTPAIGAFFNTNKYRFSHTSTLELVSTVVGTGASKLQLPDTCGTLILDGATDKLRRLTNTNGQLTVYGDLVIGTGKWFVGNGSNIAKLTVYGSLTVDPDAYVYIHVNGPLDIYDSKLILNTGNAEISNADNFYYNYRTSGRTTGIVELNNSSTMSILSGDIKSNTNAPVNGQLIINGSGSEVIHSSGEVSVIKTDLTFNNAGFVPANTLFFMAHSDPALSSTLNLVNSSVSCINWTLYKVNATNSWVRDGFFAYPGIGTVPVIFKTNDNFSVHKGSINLQFDQSRNGAKNYEPLISVGLNDTVLNGYSGLNCAVELANTNALFTVTGNMSFTYPASLLPSGSTFYRASLTGDKVVQYGQSSVNPLVFNSINLTNVSSTFGLITEGAADIADTLQGIQLTVKAALQGYVQSNADPNTYSMVKSDTITVYLVDIAQDTVGTYVAILDKDSLTADCYFANVSPGDYFIGVSHNNHITTWSTTEVNLTSESRYDFTTALSQAAGENQIMIKGIACMYSGDVNKDGFVDFSDLAIVDNASYNFEVGDIPADCTGDEFVDFSDMVIADNNSYQFVGEIRPF